MKFIRKIQYNIGYFFIRLGAGMCGLSNMAEPVEEPNDFILLTSREDVIAIAIERFPIQSSTNDHRVKVTVH